MNEPIDYSLFDRPEISMIMFYPQRVWSQAPPGSTDHMVPVSHDVAISTRFYVHDKQAPSILFFHGNGEIACQYDDIAPRYAAAGANLFAADFRGYGQSGGQPSFSTMISDARAVFEYFRDFLARDGYSGALFVKGRSLGAHSALEVAARFQGELAGLITESGSAALRRMAERYDLGLDKERLERTLAMHDEKVRSIRLPFLAIHGDADELVPIETAIELYDAIDSDDKHIEIIPNAGHNDLLWVGLEQYFDAVRKFISR